MRPGLRALTMSFLAACGDSTEADGGTIVGPTTGSVTPTTGSVTPTTGSVTPTTGSVTPTTGSESPTSSTVTGEPVTSDPSSSTTTGETSTTSTTSTSPGETTATTGAALCGLDPEPAGAIAVVSGCGGSVAKDVVDPYNLQLEWKYAAPGAGMYSGVTTTPAVGVLRDDDGDGDVDADDNPVIVFVEASAAVEGNLTVLRGDGSGTIFKVPGMFPAATPALGDIDGDGAPDIVAFNKDKQIVAIDNTGATKWVSVAFEEAWLITSNTLADLDGDGDVEVLGNHGIVDGKTGALIAPLEGKNANAVVAADLDLDGQKEVVVGLTAYSSTGVELWSFGNSVNKFSAVLNADADPEAEVFLLESGRARLREHDGTLIWTVLLDDDVPIHTPGLPCVADFDGDGESEIGAAESSVFTMLEPDGSVLWTQKLYPFYASGGCVGYDVEGDGAYEVFVTDWETFYIFDGATGTPLLAMGIKPETPYRTPVIADVDKDGSAEVLITMGNDVSPGLRVYGHVTNGWSGAGRSWASHDYAVTNQNPDGSVPSLFEPPWLTHNLFRARPTVDSARPDLTVSITQTCVDCASEAQVTYQVCNQGGLDVAAGVAITLYALDSMVEVPVETRMLPAVTSGECLAGDVFSFDPALVVDGEVVVRLHDDGYGPVPGHECSATNDRAAAVVTGC